MQKAERRFEGRKLPTSFVTRQRRNGPKSLMSRIIKVLAFGLWSGAMIGFAFIFAPVAFKALGPTPVFAALIARTIGAITVFGYGCGACAIAASLLDLKDRYRAFSLTAIAIVMIALTWYEMHAVVPIMERTPIASPAYSALHRQSSTIYGFVLLLGLIALIWSASTSRTPDLR
jgi:Domain of unknown function (DUF4149)